MALKSPLSVRLEAPQSSFGDVMNRIRTWLDCHNIAPAAFKSDLAAAGTIAIDVGFRSEDEAHLFEREFGNSLSPGLSDEKAAVASPMTNIEIAAGSLPQKFISALRSWP